MHVLERWNKRKTKTEGDAHRRPSLVFAALLLLAGCATETMEPAQTSKPQPPPPRVTEEVPAVRLPLPPPAKPTPPPQIARLPTPAPIPQSPPAQEVPTAPVEAPSPERLMGLDQGQTQQLLGEPRQRAEAAPATIWRYTARSCELDIYFYLDLQSKVMRVLHYEIRNEDPPEQRPERCFGDLVAQRQPKERAAADTDRAR